MGGVMRCIYRGDKQYGSLTDLKKAIIHYYDLLVPDFFNNCICHTWGRMADTAINLGARSEQSAKSISLLKES